MCETCLQGQMVSFGKLKQSWIEDRQPLVGILELTCNCNFECKHCYTIVNKKKKELTFEQILNILNILKEKGVLILTLTGGEPLIRNDFKEIYLASKKLGFIIDLNTNATLLNEEIVDFLDKYPPRVIDISIYGLNDDEYFGFTGIQNGFTKLISGLSLLKKKNIKFMTKTVVTKDNYDKLNKYSELAFSYNAPFRYNLVIGERVNGNKEPLDYEISKEQVIELEKSDPYKNAIYKDLCVSDSLPINFDKDGEWPLYLCGAGLNNIFISYDGRVSPCMTMRNKGLDIFVHGIDKIWEELGKLRSIKASSNFKCIKCEYLPICTPCVEEFEKNGNREKPFDKQCEMAELRYKTFCDLKKM
jgi:radical SAM protein with 4Fe4S-binding SPASM domain